MYDRVTFICPLGHPLLDRGGSYMGVQNVWRIIPCCVRISGLFHHLPLKAGWRMESPRKYNILCVCMTACSSTGDVKQQYRPLSVKHRGEGSVSPFPAGRSLLVFVLHQTGAILKITQVRWGYLEQGLWLSSVLQAACCHQLQSG